MNRVYIRQNLESKRLLFVGYTDEGGYNIDFRINRSGVYLYWDDTLTKAHYVR